MHRSLLLLAIVGAQGQQAVPYYKLDNMMESFERYTFSVEYESLGKMDCTEGVIQIPFHPDPAVRKHQCFAKCLQEPNVPGCADHDSSGSNVLCLNYEKLYDLCTSLGECWGVSVETPYTSKWRGYLLSRQCQGNMQAGTGHDTFMKKIVTSADCALGRGVLISGGSYTHLEGLYMRNGKYEDEPFDSDDEYGYTQVFPEMGSKIVWHHSRCGWAVLQDMTDPPTPAPTPKSCEDDNPAANYAFGYSGEDEIENICGEAASAWGEGSYCRNKIFAAMCPKTCSGPCEDNDEALGEYTTMTGLFFEH
jgi:hypothetical protein